jgi:DNA-binding transcriptional LysR family regulator
MDEVLREVGNFAHGAVGNVRIGTGATTAEYLLPEVCSAVLAQTPGVTFEIVIGMNDVLRQSLRAGNLDVVVGPLSAGDEEEWVVHDLGEDVVVVAAAREHELIGHPVDVRDLRAYRWVLPAASVATRQWLDRAFEAQGLPGPEVQIQTNVISLLPRLIAKTDLLSFISRRNLGPGRAGEPLAEIPVAATTMPRRLGLVHRKDGYLPPAALQFISVIRSKADEVLRSS